MRRKMVGLWSVFLTMGLLALPAFAAPSVAALAQRDPTPTLTPGADSFTNPVLDHDFPDPDALDVGDTYYAYATNSDGVHVQVARSSDLVTWELLPDALPELPAWAVPDFGWTWAPEVTVIDDRYVMYYVTRFAIQQGGTQCIGAATSDAPEGPFEPVGGEPFICQVGQGGSIDPSTFVDDDGTRYILWKNDGNSGGGQTWLYIQPLAPDGLTLVGEPVRLITADRPWEGVLVEAPTLWKHGDRYYLFYSANDYASPRYAIGYAVADDVLGPYTKAGGPLLVTSIPGGLVGPGGQDIVVDDDGETWLLYHAWTAEGYRNLNLIRLTWPDGPALEGAHRGPQPIA